MECFLIGKVLVTSDALKIITENRRKGESVPVVSRSVKHHERNSRKPEQIP
jgi:hypothetical protein